MIAHNRKIIYIAGFLFSIPMALTSYINSSFLENHINAYNVSITYIVSSVLSILLMLKMPDLLTKIGNRLTTLVFGVLTLLSYLGLAFSNNSSVIVASFILYFVSTNFILASLDIFIEDFSSKRNIGSARGMYLMIINSAWVISQVISGSIIAKSSFKGIYLFSAGFILLFSVIFIIFLKNFKDPKYKKVPVIKTARVFINNKNISRIYVLNFLLRFFFAWMIIYTPIYLVNYMNFGWAEIGGMFSIMLLPFVFLGFPLGKLSDKIGEKKILTIGFLVSAFSLAFIPFFVMPNFWLWAGILFMTRVGAATIEVMSETYFFKSVSEEDDDVISFFRNTMPLSFIVAPLVAIPVLYLVPSFKYIFFVLSAVMFFGALISLRLRDVR